MKYKMLLFSFLLVGCVEKATVKLMPGPQGDPGADGRNGTDGNDGADGKDGANGHSLVSQTVTLHACNEEENLECANGGQRLDIYLDLDDSLSVSESDLYTGSLIACNGLNGLNGRDGLDGAQGPQGEQGPRGIPGRRGPRGRTGPQGPQGERGEQGPMGPVGPQGPQGEAGIQGVAGLDGQNGEDGEDGAQGPMGPVGPQGAVGPSGSGATITTYTANSCTLIAGTAYYVKRNGSNNAFYTGSTCHSSTKVAEIGDDDSFWASANKLAVSINGGGVRVINFN